MEESRAVEVTSPHPRQGLELRKRWFMVVVGTKAVETVMQLSHQRSCQWPLFPAIHISITHSTITDSYIHKSSIKHPSSGPRRNG